MSEFTKEAIELDKMCVSEIIAKYESSHNAITVLKRKFRQATEGCCLEQIQQQRDDLLEALKELVDIIDSGSVMDTFTTQPAKAAKAAIAKCEA